jgi:hypothetical protein
LALGYAAASYAESSQSVQDLLKLAHEADGGAFEGWKGGSYMMDRKTPLWIANPGNVTECAIAAVVPLSRYRVVLTSGKVLE